MRKNTLKFLSTVLSATTVMSMLTAMPAVAVDDISDVNVESQPVSIAQAESVAQAVNTVQAENITQDEESITQIMGGQGDLTLEVELPEDVTVINSAKEYYSVQGKKYRIPSGGVSASLPDSVDNSQSEYFPKIDSQGGIGACVAWAQSYYQFTYEMNRSRGVATTQENTFSPKFIYNMANGGVDKGSVSQYVYKLMQDIGNVPITMVPYDNDYLSWSPKRDIWRESIRYRVKNYQYFDEVGNDDTQITSPDDEDLDAIKTALSNGDVLTYSTHIQNWVTKKITTNTAAPENAKYANQQAITHMNGTKGGHRMTLVGYNDNLWIDVNGNKAVDAGEMGAFKIANSWGDDYGNDGFIWIAYDALNKQTAVEGGPTTRSRIFTSIARIDVAPYNSHADIYLVYTFNSSCRRYTNAIVTAEKDGTTYTFNALSGTMLNDSEAFSYDGTKNSNDGTMVLALNNVVPDLTSENFNDYTWNVEFVDNKQDNIVLTVKDAEIVDETANKVYKPQNAYPITLDKLSKKLQFAESDSNNVVVYYRGYENPKINYKTINGDWVSADGIAMPRELERRGYVNKYVIEFDEQTDVLLYFSDDKGNIDDNNGQYYKVSKGLNYLTTENVVDPLQVKISRKDLGPLGTTKLVDFKAEATGGYEPYLYQFVYKNLDTGATTTKTFLESSTGGEWFNAVGNYRVTVNVKDYSDNIQSASMEFYLENKPFEYTEFTVNPDKHIMIGDDIELTAVTNFENMSYAGYITNQHTLVIKNESGNVVYNKTQRVTKGQMNYKTSTTIFPWVPTKAGSYTAIVSSTDTKKQYAEKTVKFDVTEYNGTMIGDADNNKEINVTDAILVMKYNIGSISESDIWLRLTDGNKDDVTDIKDAIQILRYVVESGNYGFVGEVNHRETPTEPPTDPPTQPPTEPPTVTPVGKNVVTFSNAHNWGGTIYCYYWSDSNKSMTTWPGKPMTFTKNNSYGQAQYTFNVPDGAKYIIFTNGSSQTVDITYSGGEVKYYPTTTNSKGHYNVATWE